MTWQNIYKPRYLRLKMRRKVDFLIRYEHKVRELESILLIKLELERRGYSVALVCNFEYENEIRYKPKVFIAPAVYTDGQLYGDWYKYGLIRKIANLQWEQLLGVKEEEDINGFHNIKGIGTRILNYCWGERSSNRIINGGVLPDRAPVVGQINTDLLRGSFRSLLLTKQELSDKYKIDCSKTWYLFISSFAFCEMDEHQANLSKAQFGEEDFQLFTDESYKSRDSILNWFEIVLNNNPEIIIIYRPHPDETERCMRLKEMTLKYPNFKMISTEAIKHWINAADKIYNWYSTGIIDAIVLDKPIRMLRPVLIKEDLDYRFMHNAILIETQDSFLEDYSNKENKRIFDRSLLNSYVTIPENFVYLNICDILEEIIKTNKYDIHYTIKERLNLLYIIYRRKIFIIAMHYLGFIPNKIWPYFIRKRIESHQFLHNMRQNGYKKNYATEEEVTLIEKRLKPLVHGK